MPQRTGSGCTLQTTLEWKHFSSYCLTVTPALLPRAPPDCNFKRALKCDITTSQWPNFQPVSKSQGSTRYVPGIQENFSHMPWTSTPCSSCTPCKHFTGTQQSRVTEISMRAHPEHNYTAQNTHTQACRRHTAGQTFVMLIYSRMPALLKVHKHADSVPGVCVTASATALAIFSGMGLVCSRHCYRECRHPSQNGCCGMECMTLWEEKADFWVINGCGGKTQRSCVFPWMRSTNYEGGGGGAGHISASKLIGNYTLQHGPQTKMFAHLCMTFSLLPSPPKHLLSGLFSDFLPFKCQLITHTCMTHTWQKRDQGYEGVSDVVVVDASLFRISCPAFPENVANPMSCFMLPISSVLP